MQIIYDGRKVQAWEFVFQGMKSENAVLVYIVMGLLL